MTPMPWARHSGSSGCETMARRKYKRRPGWRKPDLTAAQILGWADALHRRTGRWPRAEMAPNVIPGSLGEKWSALNSALNKGSRGLPASGSLPRLLAEHRGVRNTKGLSRLSEPQILAWADAFHKRAGKWPRRKTSGAIPDASFGDTWLHVDDALTRGLRGLRGGSSLAHLLFLQRGVRSIGNLPRLTVKQILTWADAYHDRTGRWPRQKNYREAIPGSSGENWLSIHQALRLGLRGFRGGSSLAQLLAQRRGMRNVGRLPRLTLRQILKWAGVYRQRTGRWPACRSPKVIDGSSGETWLNVDQALRRGLRGLPGGSSLAILLAGRRSA